MTKNSGSGTTADEEDYLRVPDAVTALAKGMYASFQQPKPLHKIKLDDQKASVVFGPWKEDAAQHIRAAICDGRLPLYARSNSSHLVLLRPDVVSRLITVRGGLPAHPIRPSLKTAGGDVELLKVLNSGVLLIRQDDFAAWYESERRKGRWPSQRLKKGLTGGRPTKITGFLRSAVAEALRERKRNVAKLHRDLVTSGRTDVPSVDTLERLVDQLYRETGRPEFFRTKRRHRMRT
jgi:hypothetical protein